MSNPYEQTLRECIDHFTGELVTALHAGAGALTQKLDDRLINEASAERRKLLSTLRQRLDEHWVRFCQSLHEQLNVNALRKAGLADGEAEDNAPLASLTLVDDEQMEFDLALGGLGGRIGAAVGETLGDFEGRISRLVKRNGGDDKPINPLDPASVVSALKNALPTIAPETDLRRTFLVMLDAPLSELLKKQYAVSRDWLVDQGVEPAPRARLAGAARNAGGGASAGASDAPEGVVGVLQQLMQNAGGGGPGGTGGGGTAGAGGLVTVPAAMLESLNRLQSLDLSALQSGGAFDAESRTNVLRDLRQHDSVRSLPPMEAVTIDIVATLFDFIFDDALVPDSVKALVGRLQIPLLKVAMLDKSFFSNKEHPARALLNEISRASIAAGKNLAQGDPVFEKIRAVVNRVLAESEKEQKVFSEVLAEIKALLAEQEARSEQIAEQSKAVAQQLERGEQAEIEAGDAFVRILEGGVGDDVPPHIGDFLTRKYPLVMKRAMLSGGTNGVAWALATQTLSDLLWTLKSKENPEDRQRMISLLPNLLRRLHAFLDKVGVTPAEKEPFIDALAQQHSRVIKGSRKNLDRKGSEDNGHGDKKAAAPKALELALPGSGHIASQGLAPTVVVTRVVQEDGVEVETMTVSGRAAGTRPVRRLDVSSIQRGDWVEFVSENGETLRARLTWTSPQRGVMLFTNPRTSRAVSISPEAMAIQLKRGQAKILGDNPMLERALDKALASAKA